MDDRHQKCQKQKRRDAVKKVWPLSENFTPLLLVLTPIGPIVHISSSISLELRFLPSFSKSPPLHVVHYPEFELAFFGVDG